ncbi:hypothetical protein CMI42_01930 [Candidatus Pacearchaeota archaeon]|nr:hypothetical protein [Candidatus Pacearchaeota archaeon]
MRKEFIGLNILKNMEKREEQLVLFGNYPKIEIMVKEEVNMVQNLSINDIIRGLENLQIGILSELTKNNKSLSYFNPPSEKLDDENLNFMLLNNGEDNLVFQTHKLLISQIIYYSFFEKTGVKKDFLKRYLFSFNKSNIDENPTSEVGSVSGAEWLHDN